MGRTQVMKSCNKILTNNGKEASFFSTQCVFDGMHSFFNGLDVGIHRHGLCWYLWILY